MSEDTIKEIIKSLKILEQLITLQQQSIKHLEHKVEVLQEKVFDE